MRGLSLNSAWNDNLSLSSHRSGTTFWGSIFIFTGRRIYLASTASNSSGEMEAQTGSWCLESLWQAQRGYSFLWSEDQQTISELGEKILDLCMVRSHVKSPLLEISDTGHQEVLVCSKSSEKRNYVLRDSSSVSPCQWVQMNTSFCCLLCSLGKDWTFCLRGC